VLAVGIEIGQYRIERQLGEGGIGAVYRALDTKLGRPVAIKVLSQEVADAEARRRFQRERYGSTRPARSPDRIHRSTRTRRSPRSGTSFACRCSRAFYRGDLL
jgi:serine/threonine protein kinase